MSRLVPQGGLLRVTPTDTGLLVALINQNDPYHAQAHAAMARLPKQPLLTTWPCLTEAMYLLFQAGGHAAQEELWHFMADGLVVLHVHTQNEGERMRGLMAQYKDAPMDLADASLVAAAEALSATRVFTFDGHFYAYRTAQGAALHIVP